MEKHGFVLAISAVAVALALAGPTASEWLRYDRPAILHGELWRLLGGNLVHLGWPHLVLNVVGLGLVWAFFGPCLSMRAWWWTGLASALGTSLGLLIFNPQVIWYVGLSGALHGLFVAGGMAELRVRRGEAALLLTVLTAKLTWEQWTGPLPGSEAAAGGPVLVDAHLYGAISGVLVGATFLISRYKVPPANKDPNQLQEGRKKTNPSS